MTIHFSRPQVAGAFLTFERVKDDKLWLDLARLPAPKDGQESPQVLQVNCVVGPRRLVTVPAIYSVTFNVFLDERVFSL